MKIAIFADSHGDKRSLARLYSRHTGAEGFIFLGDGCRDFDSLERLPGKFYISVKGNNDLGSAEPAETLVSLGDFKTLICHGHFYGVKQGPFRLLAAAKKSGARLALYGHTHLSSIEEKEGVCLVCPGPAGGSAPSCAVLTIEEDQLSASIFKL